MPTSVRTNRFHDPFAIGTYAFGTSGATLVRSAGTFLATKTAAVGTAGYGAIRGLPSLVISTTYTVSFEYNLPGSASILYRPGSSTTSTTGQTNVGALTTLVQDGTWRSAIVSFATSSTTPATTPAGLVLQFATASAVGVTAALRNIIVRVGTYTASDMAVFSGDNADTTAFVYAWTGVATESTSTETFSWQDAVAGATSAIGVTAHALASVNLTGASSIGVADVAGHALGLTASASIVPSLRESLQASCGLTPAISVEVLPSISAGVDNVTFSYWEKRRKDFGQYPRAELKPFWYQSDALGVHVVRQADGTFTTVEAIDEVLENAPDVRIYYGGKNNPVTDAEASELDAAGYGDYLTVRVEDAFNQGAYNEGDYGA